MKNKSFSLIELIIALSLITAGVIGAFGVFQKIIISTSIASSRLIASYLAQEGIEIVRNIRDSNWLEDAEDPLVDIEWSGGLTGCQAGCEADYRDQKGEVDSYGGRYLKIDGGFYNYNSGDETRFKRKITITPVEDDEFEVYKLEVLVEVEWEEHGGSPKISAQENLYDWFK